MGWLVGGSVCLGGVPVPFPIYPMLQASQITHFQHTSGVFFVPSPCGRRGHLTDCSFLGKTKKQRLVLFLNPIMAVMFSSTLDLPLQGGDLRLHSLVVTFLFQCIFLSLPLALLSTKKLSYPTTCMVYFFHILVHVKLLCHTLFVNLHFGTWLTLPQTIYFQSLHTFKKFQIIFNSSIMIRTSAALKQIYLGI